MLLNSPMSAFRETREPFLRQYWGEVTEMDHQNTGNITWLRDTQIDPEHAVQLFNDCMKVWANLISDDELVCDDIGAGEPFDPFDQWLSEKFYQASGAILLVDVERTGVGLREIPLQEDHERKFRCSSAALFSEIQEDRFKKYFNGLQSTNTLPPRADLAFSDPEDSSTLYDRSVRLLAMLRTVTGASIAVEPTIHVTVTDVDREIGEAHVNLKPLKDTITRGMPTVGESVLERDENGEPLHVKRIRSLTVIRRGLFKPPRGNTPVQRRKLSQMLAGVLTPVGPQIADI